MATLACIRRRATAFSDSQNLAHILFVPARTKAFGLDPAPAGGLLLEQIEGNAAKPGKVLGAVALADAALILVEGHVERPVQVVLHAPVVADGLGDARGIGAVQAADEVASFAGDLVSHVTFTFHRGKAL